MGIDYSDLRHGPSDFKDGLGFFQDIKEWANEYERNYMIPNKYNHQLAEETTRILLVNVPGPFKRFGKSMVTALMDERLRRAMLYDDPSPVYLKMIKFIFGVRKFLLWYLIPPRPYVLRYNPVSVCPDPKTGRYHMSEYDSEPWQVLFRLLVSPFTAPSFYMYAKYQDRYVKSTFLTRNSPLAWFRWAIGGPYPDGKHYKPEGYKIFEIGPKKLENHGQEECKATRDRLMASNRGTCPFAL